MAQAVAAGAPPPPPHLRTPPESFGITSRTRGEQSGRYLRELQRHFKLRARNLSAADLVARHTAVVCALYAGCRGVPPDASAWKVTVTEDGAARRRYTYAHPALPGPVFRGLGAVSAALAEAVHAALHAAPAAGGGEPDEEEPLSPMASADAAAADADGNGARALAQVLTVVEEKGACAARAAAPHRAPGSAPGR
jgi:hypothetical protein